MVDKSGILRMTSGIEGLSILKTTQSGFEGFIRDKYTMLPETRERMMATEVTASWRYSFESLSSLPLKPLYFTERYMDLKEVLLNTFFGPSKEGVYSPSVQATLYEMAKAVLGRFPDISFIQLKMPNLHFLPVNLPSKDNPVIVKLNHIMVQSLEAGKYLNFFEALKTCHYWRDGLHGFGLGEEESSGLPTLLKGILLRVKGSFFKL